MKAEHEPVNRPPLFRTHSTDLTDDELLILAASNNVESLADQLINRCGIPKTEPRDALQISLAAVNGIQCLVTLNFTHIANAETRLLIEQICRDSGYVPPLICSPDELLGI
jgi:hypothetical protein